MGAYDVESVSLDRLIAHVDRIAEIPNSLRAGTEVLLVRD